MSASKHLFPFCELKEEEYFKIMADYTFFIQTVTGLVNERIGKEKMITANEVEGLFAFKKMDQNTLLSLSKNLANETRNFPAFELKLLDDETESIQKMVDLGLVSFEWREEKKEDGEEDEDKEEINPPKNGKEENSNTPSLFRAAFLQCVRNAASVTECSELFVVFDIDKISMYKKFVELQIMPLVAHYVIKGLELNCSLESMPVKPCRRKDNNEVWCQLMTSYENTSVTKEVLNFAEKSPLARSSRAHIPRRIKVYFSLDDTVNMDNPWGSCPLLHSGTNYRTPEFSRYFNEFTDSKVDCDTAENTCFIYSQKNPTIEIPSKLNTEAEIVMRGVVSDAKYLFGEEGEEDKGMDNKKLVIALALSHPKSRIRNIGNFYFSAYLPKCSSSFEKTLKCPTTHRISVGRDANIVPPSKKIAVEEKEEENDGKFIKNSISRKMSVSSFRCLACRGAKCSERDKFHKTPAAVRVKHRQNHLYHGSGMKIVDILFNSTKNNMSKRLANAIIRNPTFPKFTMKNCDNAAVCHNFFCRGVQSVCTPFSSPDIKKNKLVLYGKVVDVVNTNHSAGVPINRKRIFYTSEELNRNEVPIHSEDAKIAFKDIMCHECNESQIKLHTEKNNVTASSTSKNKKWWKTMIDLTTDFDRHVEQFYINLANLQQSNSKLFDKNCRTLFAEFNEKCKKYTHAKSMFLDIKKEEEKEGGNEISEIIDVLEEYHARDDAATSALMHKSMFLGSRTVFSGVRCVVSEENRKFDVRQYIITMAGSAVTKVTEKDLIEYTPVKGAVSVTTAPNDKLPVGAHQTWQDDTDNTKSLIGCNHFITKYGNWRTESFNHRPASTPSIEKYVIPPLRTASRLGPSSAGARAQATRLFD